SRESMGTGRHALPAPLFKSHERPHHPQRGGCQTSPRRALMNKHALCFGVCAALLLAAGTASAGTCSGEIEALQKTNQSTGTSSGTSIPQGTNAQVAANSAADAGTGVTPAPDVNGTDASGGMMASTSPSGSGAGTGTAPGKVEQPDASGGTLANQGAGG